MVRFTDPLFFAIQDFLNWSVKCTVETDHAFLNRAVNTVNCPMNCPVLLLALR